MAEVGFGAPRVHRRTAEQVAEALWVEAERRLGPERATVIRSLGLGLATGLALVESIELSGEDEPDFLDGGAV